MQLLDEVKKLFNFTDDVELARYLKKDKSTISKWRTSGEIPAKAERELEKILRESFPSPPPEEVPPDASIKIPLYNALGDCGPGALNHHDQVENWLSFTAEYARATFGTSGAGLRCLRASGDSMSPTISPGDLIIIDSSESTLTRDGAVYVLRMGDTISIKRLHRLPGNIIRISSDNEMGWNREMTFDEAEADGVTIVGRVVFVGRLT
jgi:phage repressor protein C with HTH and peptisase S24 domain